MTTRTADAPHSTTLATVMVCFLMLGMMAPMFALQSLEAGESLVRATLAPLLAGGAVMALFAYLSHRFTASTKDDRGESGLLVGDYALLLAALLLGNGAMWAATQIF